MENTFEINKIIDMDMETLKSINSAFSSDQIEDVKFIFHKETPAYSKILKLFNEILDINEKTEQKKKIFLVNVNQEIYNLIKNLRDLKDLKRKSEASNKMW